MEKNPITLEQFTQWYLEDDRKLLKYDYYNKYLQWNDDTKIHNKYGPMPGIHLKNDLYEEQFDIFQQQFPDVEHCDTMYRFINHKHIMEKKFKIWKKINNE